MKSLEHYVDQMNQLLNELVLVATKLRDISLQVISEEELTPLQKRQDELLIELEKIDQKLHDSYRDQVDSATQQKFHDQLQTFQTLNQEFVQNLNSSHGLIQFELHRLKGDEDFPQYNRLKKMSSPPDSSEAIESEENEED